MPWTPKDATSHTKLADTPRRKRMWASVANNQLKRTGSDRVAIESANAAVRRDHRDQAREEGKVRALIDY